MGIEPISGFPEHLPADCLAEQRLIEQIKRQYELFGFTPLETSAVERLEVLRAKGDMARQIYSLHRPAEDDMPTDLGLHFDLTVPLARYVVQNSGQLQFPFRRYQIQKVWRGERAQKGRFKEFYQCDIDIVGRNSLDPLNDAECVAAIQHVFSALKVPGAVIHLSDRRIWLGFSQHFSLTAEQLTQLLGILDKTHKIGVGKVRAELAAQGFAEACVETAIELIRADSIVAARSILDQQGIPDTGLDFLAATMEAARSFGCPETALRPDFSIARGLDYYTGTVVETFITGYEDWGSVCSGGRYDDLAAFFGGQKYPGVGVSIGLSRLFSLMKKQGWLDSQQATPARVLVTMLNRDQFLQQYLQLSSQLRQGGIPTEVYVEKKKGLGDQLAYAARKGLPYAIIAAENEFSRGVVKLKDLRAQQESEVPLSELVERLRLA